MLALAAIFAIATPRAAAVGRERILGHQRVRAVHVDSDAGKMQPCHRAGPDKPCQVASPSDPTLDGPYTQIRGRNDPEIWGEWSSHEEPEIYRPWETRFVLRPEDANSESVHFKYGYSHYAHENPHHPVSTNSVDRNAESSVILVFVLAALSTVVGAVFAWEFLQGPSQSDRHQNSLVAALTIPWAIASWWIMRIALSNFYQPGREGSGMMPGMQYNWQCDAATWYLFIAPGLTLLTILTHALWLFGGITNTESQAPMGRMLPGTWTGAAKETTGPAANSSHWLGTPGIRYFVLFLEMSATFLGFLLALELMDAGMRSNCEPDVWWTAVVLASATASVLLLSMFVATCGAVGAFGDLQGAGAEGPQGPCRQDVGNGQHGVSQTGHLGPINGPFVGEMQGFRSTAGVPC